MLRLNGRNYEKREATFLCEGCSFFWPGDEVNLADCKLPGEQQDSDEWRCTGPEGQLEGFIFVETV